MVRATAITPEPIASYPKVSWYMTRAYDTDRSPAIPAKRVVDFELID
jgi:hypothetical protein